MATQGFSRIVSVGLQPLKSVSASMHLSFRNYSTDFIIRSALPDISIPRVRLIDTLMKNTSKWEHYTALECGLTGRRYTYSELWESSQRFGNALVKLGLRPKEVVGIISPNIPEYAIATLGTIKMGGVITPINHNFTAEEVARQLKIADAKYLLTVPPLLPVVHKIRDIYSGIQEVIVVGETVEKCIKFSDMLKEDGGVGDRAVDVDIHDTVFLMSSSGTTGLPKGVMLTHYSINSVISLLQECKYYSDSTNSFREAFVCLLPLFHVYGMVAILLMGLLHGAKVVTLPRFEPTSFVNVLDSCQLTVLHLVTPMFAFLSDYPKVKKKHFENTHCIMYGGAPIGMSLINKLKQKVYPADPAFVQGYGMTECFPIAMCPKDQFVLNSCGKVVSNTKVKVIDLETGDSLGPNQTGEICAQGPQTMKGYVKHPEATAETIRDGWVHTGDVGYYDDNGYFFIVDRIKELIKVSGHQVSPSELEDILQKHPSVQDAGVIGIPDDVLGELPRAYIIRKDTTVTEGDIMQFVSSKVAPHKRLGGGVVFTDAIPRTAAGKILRRELKEKALTKT